MSKPKQPFVRTYCINFPYTHN